MSKGLSRAKQRRLVDLAAAADHLGVSERTMKYLHDTRQVPHYPIGKRLIRFDLNDLDEYLDRGRVPAVTSRRSA